MASLFGLLLSRGEKKARKKKKKRRGGKKKSSNFLMIVIKFLVHVYDNHAESKS